MTPPSDPLNWGRHQGVIDRRTLLRGTLAAAGAVALGSCVKTSPTDDAPVRTPVTAPPDLTTPRPRSALRLAGGDLGFPSPFAYIPPNYGRMILIYDALVHVDAAGRVAPWLATRYDRSPDGRVYNFELRDGVRWHDGRPFTAEDVAFTFRYYAEQKPKLPSTVLFGPENVEAAEATGPRNVEIRLTKPTVTFLEAVAARVPIVPRHVWAGIDDASSAQDMSVLIGTGPYRLEQYESGAGAYLFAANDAFFLGKPFVKRIEMRPVGNELLALRAAEIDAGGLSIDTVHDKVLDRFRRDPSYVVIDGPANFVYALYWNAESSPVMADARFRRACTKAIDRRDIATRLLGGNGEPGNPGFLPPGHRFRVDVEQHGFDRAAANRLLDEAGYRRGRKGTRIGPDGEPLRMTMKVLVQTAPLAQLVVDALKKVGVEVVLDPVDRLDLVFGAAAGDYEAMLLVYGGIQGDADYMRTVYSSRVRKSFHSVHGWSDPEFDDLADKQLVTFDEAERKRLVARMQEIVARDVPLLHLIYPTPYGIYRKAAFEGWAFSDEAAIGDKRSLVTGLPSGLAVRPFVEAS